MKPRIECNSHPTPFVGCPECLALLRGRAETAERNLANVTHERRAAIALVVALAKMAGISEVDSGLVVDFLESRYDER